MATTPRRTAKELSHRLAPTAPEPSALDRLAGVAGLDPLRLLLHIAAQRIRIRLLERKIAKLEARLQALAPHEVR